MSPFTPEWFARQGATLSYRPPEAGIRSERFRIDVGRTSSVSVESWTDAAEHLATALVADACRKALEVSP